MKENKDAITAAYEDRATGTNKGVTLRNQIAREQFEDLPDAEQARYTSKAEELAAETSEKHKQSLSGLPSTEPEDQLE